MDFHRALSFFRWPTPKRFVAYGLCGLSTLILMEAISFVSFTLLTGQRFDFTEFNKQRLARMAAIQEKLEFHPRSALLYDFHPYLGYVGHPGGHPLQEIPDASFNSYGMVAQVGHQYPSKKKNNELVIAVVGGSVSEIFSNLGEEALNTYVRALNPHFTKHITLISLGIGGYKQPQQLFSLEYALLSGFEFDAVLNIDGFNDLALASENIAKGINPLFPSGMHFGLLSKVKSPTIDAPTVERLTVYYDAYRSELRLLSFIQHVPFRYSVTLNLLGKRWSAKSSAHISQVEYELYKGAQESLDTAFDGPTANWQGETPAAWYETTARIWQQSSRMLSAICERHNLVYLHVLQPNQYVEGSKTFSDHERRIALNPKNPWGNHVRAGYKYLIDYGKQLKEEGIAFYDFTRIFEDVVEDIYDDTCCHFSLRGSEIMAKYLAGPLETRFNTHAPSRQVAPVTHHALKSKDEHRELRNSSNRPRVIASERNRHASLDPGEQFIN